MIGFWQCSIAEPIWIRYDGLSLPSVTKLKLRKSPAEFGAGFGATAQVGDSPRPLPRYANSWRRVRGRSVQDLPVGTELSRLSQGGFCTSGGAWYYPSGGDMMDRSLFDIGQAESLQL